MFFIHIKTASHQIGCTSNLWFRWNFKEHIHFLEWACRNVGCKDGLVVCDVLKSSGVVDFSGSIYLHWGTDSSSGNCFVGKTELLRLRESQWRNRPDKTDKRARERLWERWGRGGGRVEVRGGCGVWVATVMGDIQPAARVICRQVGCRQDSSARFLHLHTDTHIRTHTMCFYLGLFSKNPLSDSDIPMHIEKQEKQRKVGKKT